MDGHPYESALRSSGRRRKKNWTLAASLTGAAAMVLAACGSTSSGPKTTFIVPVAAQFSGANAAFGYTNEGGVLAALDLINKAGGVLGHRFKMVAVDTLGDPADAVPAVTRVLAQYGSAVKIFVGSSSQTAQVVAPIVTQAGIPEVVQSGSTTFDTNRSPYVYRFVPPDPEYGVAMVYWAHIHGWNKIALAFENSPSSQTNVPGAAAAAKYFGVHIVANIAIASSQTAYQSEALAIINSHPQAILSELDPATAGTFFTQYKQLSAGNVPPLIGTTADFEQGWITAMTGALGSTYLANHYYAVGKQTTNSGLAYTIWSRAVNGLPSFLKSYEPTIVINAGKQADYDFVTCVALAMLEAKSTSSAVYNRYIAQVLAPHKGGVVVHSFAEGKRALSEGRQIRYVGVLGAIDLNKYHNFPGSFGVDRLLANGAPGSETGLDSSVLNRVVV